MKICWAQYLLWLVIAILGAGSALSACGQKGPLYLPDHPAAEPAGAASSATSSTTSSPATSNNTK